MKKFLLYVVVIVTLLFLGFTVYYLSLNDETIKLNIMAENAKYLNKGEEFELPITWTKPSKGTTLAITIDSESVLKYSTETKMFKAVGGGFTTVTITPSNTNFGPFAFEVYVGDGEIGSPYVITTASGLQDMDNDKCYVLDNDIILTEAWTPIEDFSGNFNGRGHTIYDLSINSTSNAGMFANILSAGVVENVRFERVRISGEYDNVGVVAGVNNGTIGKVEVIGNITNTKNTSNTGLIVGLNNRSGSYAVVNMCSSKGALVAEGNVGGLVGKNVASLVVNCTSQVTNATLSKNDSVFGGVIGYNESEKVDEIYYPSAIAKVYTIVENATGSTIGAVIGKNVDNNDSNPTWYNKYEDIYFALGSGLTTNAVGNGASSIVDAENIVRVTKTDLLDLDTYQNFNFETVWTKDNSKYAELNFNGTYESVYIRGLKKEITNEDKSLIQFLEEIRNNLKTNSVYSITEDVTYDFEALGIASWQTVAPSISDPMNASIKVADGVTCTIKNVKLNGINNSFFGYLGKDSSINGIVFENVELENSGVNNSAVVATGLLSGATLKDVTVRNLIKFDTTATTAGIICATNEGELNNCDVTCENDAGVMLRVSDDSSTFGAVCGINKGSIKYSNVSNIKVETYFNVYKNAGYTIGGIVGKAEKGISNCSVTNLKLNSACEKQMYVGGVVGQINAYNVTVKNCTATAKIILGTGNDNYVGGVIGYLTNNSNISACAFVDGELKGNRLGGIVCVNYGDITECYSLGSVTGYEIAGLVDKNYGNVSNCYTLSTLSGESKSSTVCGLTGIVPEGSSVDRCFSAATLTGSGKKYAETASEFRINKLTLDIRNFLNGDFHYGTLTNCVVINFGSAEIQKVDIFGRTGDFIKTNEEECRGKDDYKVFREEAGFDGSVWNFEDSGEYPTLRAFN